MKIIPTYTIAGIDVPVKVTTPESIGEKTYMTLRQAVMGIKSTKQPEMNLFRAVDQNAIEGRVYFLTNEKVETEARAVVTVLPLIFEARYGPCIWRWFFELAKDAVTGYSWNEKDGVLAEEDTLLKETFEKGTLGIEEEQEIETKIKCKVTFASSVRTPGNTGNEEQSIGSVKTCSSLLSEQKKAKAQRKKERKAQKVKETEINLIENDTIASTLTNETAKEMEKIQIKFLSDPEFTKNIMHLLKDNIAQGGSPCKAL